MHGSLRPASWLTDDRRRVSMGRRGNRSATSSRSSTRSSIPIIHEEISVEVVQTAHACLSTARTICFVGFGSPVCWTSMFLEIDKGLWLSSQLRRHILPSCVGSAQEGMCEIHSTEA